MRFFTSESVTEGHPDKICDQIADAILDDILSKDPASRVACEVTATKNHVQIMGEITTSCTFDPVAIAKKVIADIGYDAEDFSPETIVFDVFLSKQSPDIAMGVDRALEYKEGKEDDGLSTGAGDQGMMFGIATDETPELMPAPILFAHKMNKKLADVRKDGTLAYLKPDGKGQVTVEYDENGNIKRIDTVVLSSQHDETVSIDRLRKDLEEKVVKVALPSKYIDEKTKIFINPTGKFVVGGPAGDSGLTGRKIIVDTYGGYGRHGGGAFSGKDSTKVDRSGAYAARYVAKNIVAAGIASKCEVQLSYAIGIAEPVSVYVETFGTGKVDERKLEEAVLKVFDLRPEAIIKAFGLRKPIFRALATYGHMGREELGVAWEKTDKVDELKKALNI